MYEYFVVWYLVHILYLGNHIDDIRIYISVHLVFEVYLYLYCICIWSVFVFVFTLALFLGHPTYDILNGFGISLRLPLPPFYQSCGFYLRIYCSLIEPTFSYIFLGLFRIFIFQYLCISFSYIFLGLFRIFTFQYLCISFSYVFLHLCFIFILSIS